MALIIRIDMRFYQVLWQTDYCYRVCRCWKLKDDPPMHGPCVYLESGPARSLGQDGSFTHKSRAEEDIFFNAGSIDFLRPNFEKINFH